MKDKDGNKSQTVSDKSSHKGLDTGPNRFSIKHQTDKQDVDGPSPEHNRSLAGSLKPYIKRTAPTEKVLRDAREAARAAAALELMNGQLLDVGNETEQ